MSTPRAAPEAGPDAGLSPGPGTAAESAAGDGPAAAARPRVRAGTVAVAVLASAAVLCAAALLPVWPALTVAGGERVLAVEAHDRLTISYIHSIDGLPIEEDLRAEAGALVVERTRLRQFGAGMGQIEGQGHGRQEGRWWVIDEMEREIGPEFHLRAGAAEIDHRLLIEDTELALSACLPGERITVYAARVSALSLLRAADGECTAAGASRAESRP